MFANEAILLLHFCAVVFGVFLLSLGGKEGLGMGFFLFLLVSNLFISKEISVFGLHITACDVYTIGSILCLNLIQEIYGKKASRRYLYLGIGGLIFFLVCSQFHISYLPTLHCEEFSSAFDILLSPTPRIVIASLLVSVIADRFDMKLFRALKNRSPSSPFWVRFLLSTLSSQLIDTILFSIIGLYGLLENIWTVALLAYLTKVIFILGSTLVFSYMKKDFFIPREIPTESLRK